MQRFTEFDFGVSWVMGFWHQDWGYEADTAAEVVEQHLPEGAGEYALAVRRDARTLLDNLPSKSLDLLWTAGSQYIPRFEQNSAAEWTRTVIGVCDTWLSAQSEVRPLTGADTEDGLAHRDAVVAEIEGMGFLAAEVRRALVDCAHHCTPDLALRVLLRVAVETPGASLSEDQYKRLDRIGSALHYGEFVVEDVKFLVAEGD
ncbi:hypothetical protein [Streptomyces sp. NBC_00459]|uniref:hypothetical protein n=1 Tax=Streptomyces sp. NBC_00459 TaxID=2975749 RepID=UPI002E190814